MGVDVFIQARLGSTRFPAKVVALLHGKPLYHHVVDRARQIAGVERVVVIASDEEDDFGSVAYPIERFPVSVKDVLDRFWMAWQRYRSAVIMRLTADCPLIDPILCAEVIALRAAAHADYASNDWHVSGYPSGLDCEVFTAWALKQAHEYAHFANDHEHVTPWMKRHLYTATLYAPRDRPYGTKCSVDTPTELEALDARLRHERAAHRDTQV